MTVDLVKQCPNWWLHLHFVTICAGEKHLLAAVPKVTDRYTPFEILISDDLVGFIIYEDNFEPLTERFTEIWIWDWKTGELKLVMYQSLSRKVSC